MTPARRWEHNLAKDEVRDLPYPFESVWDSALMILQQPGWNVVSADKGTGGLEAKIVMDLLTWTETFYVNIVRIDENATRVHMGRIGVSQPLDWGLAGQYIDSFLNKLESALRGAS